MVSEEKHVENCNCDYSTEGDRWESHTSHQQDPRCKVLNESSRVFKVHTSHDRKWLEVSRKECEELGVKPTAWSFMSPDGETYYLKGGRDDFDGGFAYARLQADGHKLGAFYEWYVVDEVPISWPAFDWVPIKR